MEYDTTMVYVTSIWRFNAQMMLTFYRITLKVVFFSINVLDDLILREKIEISKVTAYE